MFLCPSVLNPLSERLLSERPSSERPKNLLHIKAYYLPA